MFGLSYGFPRDSHEFMVLSAASRFHGRWSCSQARTTRFNLPQDSEVPHTHCASGIAMHAASVLANRRVLWLLASFKVNMTHRCPCEDHLDSTLVPMLRIFLVSRIPGPLLFFLGSLIRPVRFVQPCRSQPKRFWGVSYWGL